MSTSDESLSESSSLQHTPYCDDNCSVQHHALLLMILGLPGKLGMQEKVDLTECIAKYKATGWNVDDPIPDPIPDFRYPMAHWASALCKTSLVHYLVKNEDCSTLIQTKQGDTPLHRCIICLNIRNKRGHLLVPLLANDLLSAILKDRHTLLLLAERLHHGQISKDQFSDWLMTILEATTKMIDVGQRLKTFNTQNQQGDTVLHLLCEVRSMLPSVRRLVQEAGCNVKIRNKLGLTAMDVALNCGWYDYVTEIKSVLPTSNLVSPLRSSHPMAKEKRSSPGRTRPSSSTRTRESSDMKRAKKRSRSTDKRSKDERTPPKLEKIKTPSAASAAPIVQTPTTSKEDSNNQKSIKFSTPHVTITPLGSASDSKRPRKGTPYRVNRPKEETEQRMRVSNLDKILQSQCHGTPVASQSHTTGKSVNQSASESGQSSDNDVIDVVDHGPSTSGQSAEHTDDDNCVLCNLENGSEMPTHLENGSKVSELQVCTAAAGGSAANEPGASGVMPSMAGGDRGDGKGNSKLLTYLHMHQDFQKEIINKIHKDRRDIEKKIVEQESSIQVTAKELAKVTSESNEVNRQIITVVQQLEALKSRENELKSRHEKLRKSKKAKETKLGESRTQLAVIAQSLLELQG
ncbi:uncharacterized protein [Amphiura filiformis]|uniref:uncharacterized protein isoform X2 n=1 Tax=Amphiura filiformis TaxID=82378 RepID=UPI003B21D8B0